MPFSESTVPALCALTTGYCRTWFPPVLLPYTPHQRNCRLTVRKPNSIAITPITWDATLLFFKTCKAYFIVYTILYTLYIHDPFIYVIVYHNSYVLSLIYRHLTAVTYPYLFRNIISLYSCFYLLINTPEPIVIVYRSEYSDWLYGLAQLLRPLPFPALLLIRSIFMEWVYLMLLLYYSDFWFRTNW